MKKKFKFDVSRLISFAREEGEICANSLDESTLKDLISHTKEKVERIALSTFSSFFENEKEIGIDLCDIDEASYFVDSFISGFYEAGNIKLQKEGEKND